ncbi:MAG: peptide deformylase [Ruminococcus sp.]|nr:peptide deformylase [Ruminococcus sp.]
MVRPIVKDVVFLAQKSTPATKLDAQIITDLRDTLQANREHCIGMAANMIGFSKRIIIVSAELGDMVMINPVIASKSGRYDTEEGCLSLVGTRKTQRFESITVRYLDENFIARKGKFCGLTAQIIQHECDHLDGIII